MQPARLCACPPASVVRCGALERRVVLWDETRKQHPCIAMADRPVFVAVVIQLPREGGNNAGGHIGEIAAEQNAVTPGERLEARQRRWTR